MTLENLVKEAADKSPVFRQKWLYWVAQRKRIPTFDWLMENLELALGRQYVQEAAKAEIEAVNQSRANNDKENNNEDTIESNTETKA